MLDNVLWALNNEGGRGIYNTKNDFLFTEKMDFFPYWKIKILRFFSLFKSIHFFMLKKMANSLINNT